MVESRPAAIERVGHVLGSCLGREVEEATDLVPCILRRKLDKLLVVRAVHGEQKIEAGVVRMGDLARALARNVDAATAGSVLRPRVGGLTDMPIA